MRVSRSTEAEHLPARTYLPVLLGLTLVACHFDVDRDETSLDAAARSGATPTAVDDPSDAPDAATGNLPDIDPLTPGEGRRHVIVMIGDGMHLSNEIAGSRYLYGRDEALSFHDFPVRSFKTTWDVTTYDARALALGVPGYTPTDFDPSVGYDPLLGGELPYPLLADTAQRRAYFVGAPAPDSAATATAMSTGIKTYSAAIGVAPDYPESGILEHASALLRRFFGMSIGFATTVQFYHATPAGFFAHNPSRNDYTGIAHELLTEVRPEVMIGAGYALGNVAESDLNDLLDSEQYVYVHRESGVDGGIALLDAADEAVQKEQGLFGFFGNATEGNFAPLMPVDAPGTPAVERTAIEDPTLADAATAALRVLSPDPDGFFLMIEQGDLDRANHNNDFAHLIGAVTDLDRAVRAVEAFVDEPDDDIDWTNTTLIVTSDHANGYLRFAETLGAGELPAQAGSIYPNGEVTYGSGSHTSELVDLYVKGYAEERVSAYQTPYPGQTIIDDTSVYRLILDAARR